MVRRVEVARWIILTYYLCTGTAFRWWYIASKESKRATEIWKPLYLTYLGLSSRKWNRLKYWTSPASVSISYPFRGWYLSKRAKQSVVTTYYSLLPSLILFMMNTVLSRTFTQLALCLHITTLFSLNDDLGNPPVCFGGATESFAIRENLQLLPRKGAKMHGSQNISFQTTPCPAYGLIMCLAVCLRPAQSSRHFLVKSWSSLGSCA